LFYDLVGKKGAQDDIYLCDTCQTPKYDRRQPNPIYQKTEMPGVTKSTLGYK